MLGVKTSQVEQKYHLENNISVLPLIFLPFFFFSFPFCFWCMEENKRHKGEKTEEEMLILFEGPQKQIV